MADFILVHGSWHGAWCWDKLVPLLENRGNRVTALDLPGHGKNRAARARQTFAGYVDTVTGAIDRHRGKVVLVGHSAGGAVISQVAEARPHRITCLVYISGFMLTHGQSILDVASNDKGNEVLPASVFIEDGKAIILLPDKAGIPLYLDCRDEDVAWAVNQLVPEATEPVGAVLSLTETSYGSIPRYYIECLQDRAISIETQRSMISRQPVKRVIPMDSGHSPFLSKPEELAEHLISIL